MTDQGDGLPIGYTLGGYEIVRVIGAGGFGITYEAVNPVTARRMAIKEFFPAGLARRDTRSHVVYSKVQAGVIDWALAKFKATTTALCALDHPNILRVHDYMPANDTGYMIMELLEGRTLEQLLQGIAPRLPGLDELRPFLDPVLGALAYVHGLGLVHRDIAPDNIVVTNGGRPVLIDFGALSRDMSKATQHVGTMGIAKAHYTAPEQARRDARPEPASDVYSVSAVFYRALTGAPPEDGPHRLAEVGLGSNDPYVPLTGRPGVEPQSAAVIDTALALRRSERPQSIRALRDGLGWGQSVNAGPVLPELTTTLAHPAVLPAHDIGVTSVLATPESATTAVRLTPAPSAVTVAVSEEAKSPASPEPAPDWLPPSSTSQVAIQSVPPRSTRAGWLIAAMTGLILISASIALVLWDRDASDEASGADTLRSGSGPGTIISFGSIVNAVAFTGDGRLVIAAIYDGSVKLWDLSTKTLVSSFDSASGEVRALSLSQDGRFALAGIAESTWLWDTGTGRRLQNVTSSGAGIVNAVAFSGDGRLAASAGTHNIHIWEPLTGRLLRQLDDSALIYSLAFLPDGRSILGSGLNGRIVLWEISTGRVMRRFDSQGARDVSSITVLPDGQHAVTTSDSSTDRVLLHEIASARIVRRFPGDTKQAIRAAVSLDGRLLVSAGWDDTVRVFDVATGNILQATHYSTSLKGAVAFSADRRAVYAVGNSEVGSWTAPFLP